MLHRSSSSNPHIKKGIDTIQKHKIRNLRAKLKNLLSTDSCNKYSRRQKQIKKIESLQNLQFYQTKTYYNTQKHLFSHTKQQPKKFWYSQKQKCNVMNVFGKLSKDEIEQIKEDMIYYLGQENVGKFKEFLLIKESIRLKKQHNVMNKENVEKQKQKKFIYQQEQLQLQQQSKRLRTLKQQPLLQSGERQSSLLQQEGGQQMVDSIQYKNNCSGNYLNNNNASSKLFRRLSSEAVTKSPINQKNFSSTDSNFFMRKSAEIYGSNNGATQFNNNFVQQQGENNNINNTDLNKRPIKTANLYQSRISALTRKQTIDTQQQRQKFQANYLGNRQHFLNKRRMLEEQENAQRLLNKVSLEMKQQKAVDIFRNTQQSFISTIREKNQQNDTKTKKILQEKYKKNVTFGTIVELNQQLRKIYIKKISQIPKFSQIPQSQVINDRHKYDTTLSGFFRENSLNIKSRH